MQIRTLLLLLAIAGAVGSALSVWYVGTLKEDAQKNCAAKFEFVQGRLVQGKLFEPRVYILHFLLSYLI